MKVIKFLAAGILFIILISKITDYLDEGYLIERTIKHTGSGYHKSKAQNRHNVLVIGITVFSVIGGIYVFRKLAKKTRHEND